ncbi:RNA polymerase sigma factor [Bryobacter aggregatus]|uniref:RNA polymerase sigma factor n=1 Tax=Bryobacter aggregatus TaxID=360054 RepID=UPI00138E0540|nr:sigma-70 family RNA polymerase sigma factor [Bryobacter aggregatus]
MVHPEFERVYRESSEAVYRSAFRILGNAQDSEDVLQTVFLRFLRRDSTLGSVDKPEPYLKRAAVNAALDLIRARREKLTPIADLSQEPSIRAQQELHQRLRDALARLDPKWAEIFVLRHIEGYGNKEIASLLHMSQTLVAVTLFRARQKLQTEIRLESGSLAL